jgi:2-oxoisovalerate dehydrogenase E1 component
MLCRLFLQRSRVVMPSTVRVASRAGRLATTFNQPLCSASAAAAPSFARLFSAAAAATAKKKPSKKAASSKKNDAAETPLIDLAALRAAAAKQVNVLPEVIEQAAFVEQLRDAATMAASVPKGRDTFDAVGMGKDECLSALRAGFMTMALHTQSRVASALGHGFYTIGPCGEELLAGIGRLLRPTDAVALHYRHLAISIERSRAGGKSDADILLDRARGYTVSALDPVAGGVHCALGDTKHDYLVTSTLASQAPPAVGRALGINLASHLKVPDAHFPRDAISFVSVGDGSVNNAHFLASLNLAKYSLSKSKCPVVFLCTDNGLSISLKGNGYVGDTFIRDLGMPVFRASGANQLEVWAESKAAIDLARRKGRPVFLYVDEVPRRFGHAATDRQVAYLTSDEIAAARDNNPMLGASAQAIKAGFATGDELAAMLQAIEQDCATAFQAAVNEPSCTDRAAQVAIASAPLTPLDSGNIVAPRAVALSGKRNTCDVMRKHMTRVFFELMHAHPNMVYIGEDVRHGGYYLVTDTWEMAHSMRESKPRRLAEQFRNRVVDFPPDETTLVGAAMGFSHAGMLVVCEIPYSKYLDCGADMFFEACVMNWLSAGKQPCGMLIRLQGFDRGVFGGNFHTHNSLHIPPGLDVVCYSNGS